MDQQETILKVSMNRIFVPMNRQRELFFLPLLYKMAVTVADR